MISEQVLSDIMEYNCKVSNTDCLNFLKFDNIKHYGIPNSPCTVMAFHDIQGIIAIGNIDGKIKM